MMGCTGLIELPAERTPDTEERPVAPVYGPRKVRPLSPAEYARTMEDLLDVSVSPGPGGQTHTGFATAPVQIEDTLLLEYLNRSEDIARRALAAHAEEWLPCDTSRTDCVQPFLTDLGRRAYRRPLTEQDIAELVTLYESARAQWGAENAVELAVITILMAPELIYHVELGTRTEDGTRVALTDYELASALSYFLWGTMPDEELFAAAEAGELASAAGLEAQVRRMVNDPRTADVVVEFHRRWLLITDMNEIDRVEELFPWWSPELADALDAELDALIRGIYAEEGNLRALLTASHTFGSPLLADHYGAAPPDDDGRIELDPTARSGLLTTGAFLASHARPSEVDWIHRGLTVRKQILCDPLPPPPADVDLSATDNDLGRVDNPQCAHCHVKMDLIGMGFDRYDATGRDLGMDASGTIDQAGHDLGLPEQFTGIVELANIVADSDHVRDCYATQWYRFAAQRRELPGEQYQLQPVYDAFAQSGGDVRQLLVSIALSESFRHRQAETMEGE